MVYRAVDDRLGRVVAAKLLHRSLAGDPVFLRRFAAEARAAAALNHPNIMKVFDWGDDHTEPYLILEYLPGGTLREVLAAGRDISRPQLIRLAEESTSALAYSHARDFLHRDIKPANLIFDEDGRVRIADFGLVRALADASLTETGTGYIIGTPRYLAPEQARGEGSGARSDVYSLGLVLYECAYGSLPFRGSTPMELALSRLSIPIENPEPEDEFANAVMSMLADSPDERVSAAEASQKFHELMRGAGVVQPIVSGEQNRRPVVATPEAILEGIDVANLVDLSGGTVSLAGARDSTVAGVMMSDRTQALAPASRLPDSELSAMTVPGSRFDGSGGSTGRGKSNHHRKWPWVLLVVLILLATAAVVGYERFRPIKVPSLLRLDLASARSQLSANDLSVGKVVHVYSATLAPGQVVRELPAAGSTLEPHQKVVLYISRGHAPVVVPGFGHSLGSRAEAKLRRLGFVVAVSRTYSTNVPTGDVISQSSADVMLAYGSRVALVISKGPPPRAIPSVVGDTEAAAESALSGEAFGYQVANQYSLTVPTGVVISQSILPGTLAFPGTSVVIAVSEGPPLVAVPNVIGDTLNQASAVLNSAGFAVSLTAQGKNGNPQVTAESPAPGTELAEGSTVTITGN